jgi:hypothetical protein
MGIFKAIASLVTGGAIRPTTTRERSRLYQRRANNLLEDQLNVMQNLAQQQVSKASSDGRRRGPCPNCLEFMLVGASTCPHCNEKGISWSSTPDRCPNCVQVIPFGVTTCPLCKKTGIHWNQPADDFKTRPTELEALADWANAERAKQDDSRRREEQLAQKAREDAFKEESRLKSDDSSWQPPEVLNLRREIATICRQRDNLRLALKNDPLATKCLKCGELCQNESEGCLQCEYLTLRSRLDSFK